MVRRLACVVSSFALVAICACFAAGCANISAAPMRDVDTAGASSEFAWHDLVSLDADRARSFYGGLFGWTFQESGIEGYDWILSDGTIIGGLLDATALERQPHSSMWLNGVAVDDTDRAVRKFEAAGGKIVKEPTDVAERGRFAVVADTEGAMIQLVSDNPYARVADPPAMNAWLWAERLSDDVRSSGAFYGKALGLGVQSVSPDTVLLTSRGSPCAAVSANPFEDTAAVWVPFVRVEDPVEAVRKAASLGGRIVIAPRREVRGGSIAVILDPGGAPLALQRWNGGAS